MATPKKPAKPAKPERLVLRREKPLVLADLERLTKAEQRQFLAAATRYRRGPHPTVRAFFERFARDTGEAVEKLTVDRWTIAPASDRKTARYVLWVFDSDNGSVFELGKSTPCGVHLVQGGYEATDGTKKSAALLAALSASSPI